MRSTIFISAVLATLPGIALAQDGPTPGCYIRSYDSAHLAAHPDQVVQALRLRIFDDTSGGYANRFANLDAQFADQGHVAGDGHGAQRLTQSLVCFRDGGNATGCAVECDGGWFTVTDESDTSLTILTEYLMIGDTEGCGGAIDMAEYPGQPVRYRLQKADAVACDGM